jgi:hypothetical protein
MPELATRADVLAMKQELRACIAEFQASLDRQAQQLTIRFGVMLVVSVAVAAIILKRC